MSYQLVIAEKPSVARSIAGVIGATEKHDGYLQGNGYLVSWCIGHLVSFADAGRYDERFKKWRYEDLPILPETWQYIITDEKKQQFDILRSLMERPDVTGLICATDAGREGELIFRFVYQMAGCEKPFKRLWISSMEDSAIRDGFTHLKPGTDYDPLYQSALCRAKADWLVGINATRLFSVLYHKTLTVGRVQTPTLNLLVERDAKITNFKKEKYHIVHIGVGGADAVSSRFSDAAEANTVKAACAGAQAVCASVTREKKTEQPPKLYDLTTLQREANRLFGFTAKQTLDYAQTLYEKKLLTYPRTDSQYLTDDMLPVAESLVSGLWGLVPFAKGLNISPQYDRILNSKKVSDHHAIIPTAAFVKQGFDGLAESERKLLFLICCKVLCAVAGPYVYEAVTATFTCAGKEFTAKGKTVLSPGWKEIDRSFRSSLKTNSDEEAEAVRELPELKEGQTFSDVAASVTEHSTT
ncbi:MAG: DNA topoisomerase, partial [Clostridiales bacterium]|nr:DNA topoisomerase [Clostridiales bacterium]